MRNIALFATAAFAATAATAAPATAPYRPIFERGIGLKSNLHIPGPQLPTWTFNYNYGGSNYGVTFVGNNPSIGGSVTVPVYIIPVKLTYSTTTTDPLRTIGTGQTVIQNVIASPMFQNYPFTQGSTSLGNTQFADAFARANTWGIGGAASGYHVLLGNPTVTREISITVPRTQGGVATYFGTRVITASLNWIDGYFQSAISTLGIPTNALPIFVTTQAYLLDGLGRNAPCCVGGYHSYNNVNTYAHFTYIQTAGAFAQDVSALSHEVAEWLDDPYVNNNSPCGIYEVGDPLEGTANYGDYQYTLNGFTYNLQDEANPVYFGAPASTIGSLAGATFIGTSLGVCQNGS